MHWSQTLGEGFPMPWSICSILADLALEYKTELTWYCFHDRLEAQYVWGGSITPINRFKNRFVFSAYSQVSTHHLLPLKLHMHEAVLVEGKAAPRCFTARRIVGLGAWGRRWEFSSSGASAVPWLPDGLYKLIRKEESDQPDRHHSRCPDNLPMIAVGGPDVPTNHHSLCPQAPIKFSEITACE